MLPAGAGLDSPELVTQLRGSRIMISTYYCQTTKAVFLTMGPPLVCI